MPQSPRLAISACMFKIGFLTLLVFSVLPVLLVPGVGEGMFARTNPSVPVPQPSPTLIVQNQPQSPLVISAPRYVSNPQGPEIALDVTNVSSKKIRAFAIKQVVGQGVSAQSSVYLINLDLSLSELPPNYSKTHYSTFEQSSGLENLVSLAVDYVQFADGTSWGDDSAKSAERVAGQRAAGEILTSKLTASLDSIEAENVQSLLRFEAANLEPKQEASDEWKVGFRTGLQAVLTRLIRAEKIGGLAKVHSELRLLYERFKTDR